jgi:hypothetical protein
MRMTQATYYRDRLGAQPVAEFGGNPTHIHN